MARNSNEATRRSATGKALKAAARRTGDPEQRSQANEQLATDRGAGWKLRHPNHS